METAAKSALSAADLSQPSIKTPTKLRYELADFPQPAIYDTVLNEQAGTSGADPIHHVAMMEQTQRLSQTSLRNLPPTSSPLTNDAQGVGSSSSSSSYAYAPGPGFATPPAAQAWSKDWKKGFSGKTTAVTSHASTPSEVDRSNPLETSGEPDYLKMILTAKVYDVARITPLQYATGLSTKMGRNNHILLKREDLQPVFSFKCRGAYNRMAHLTEEEKRRGVVACSAGNHAQGVALAAQRMGIKAVIVMPTTTPAIKFRNVARLGGEVVLHGDDFDAAKKECARLQKEHGYINIPPYDDPYVIAGGGTVGLEILRQTELERITGIFVAVGGGGLIAGIAAYVKRVRPDIKIFGVETHDAACMTAALQKGERVELAEVGLFADGAAVKLAGEENFRICKNNVDGMVNVNNDEICAAIKDIFEDTRTVVEPAGALAVTGCKKYLSEHKDLSDGVYVCVTSGANMNFDRLRFVAERAALGEQREALISVIIPERPGSFMDLYSVIHPRNITEFSYRYRDAAEAHIYMSFAVLDPTRREEELKEVFANFATKGMTASDLSHNELAKSHGRYMIGGRSAPKNERILRFVFPERPGALKKFLDGMSCDWNISLWHYRNYGSDMARVLVGMQVPPQDEEKFQTFLRELKYPWTDESNNPVYNAFLQG